MPRSSSGSNINLGLGQPVGMARARPAGLESVGRQALRPPGPGKRPPGPEKCTSAASRTLIPRVEHACLVIVTARFNEGPIKNGGRRVIFVSGDHPEPTDFVKSVIESFGFVAVYLGGLLTGGRLQQAGGPLAGRDLVDFGSSESMEKNRQCVQR
jgi:hypothetical protein